MSMIRVDSFGGMAPIVAARKLPDGGAVDANFTRLEAGDLRPFRELLNVGSPITGLGDLTRLFYYTAPDGAQRWLAWGNGQVVDVCASPVPLDTLGRLYWTVAGGLPRAASQPTQGDITGNSLVVRTLGVPKPTNAPEVATSTEEDHYRRTVAAITKAKPAVLTTSEPHSFKEGDRVKIVVEGATAENPNMREISGKEFIVGEVDEDSTTVELRGSDTTNYTAVTAPGNITVDRVFTETDYKSRAYVYTLVSDWGEEGPPSKVSDVIDARFDDDVLIDFSWTRPDRYEHISKARLYRAESGTNGTEYFFVKCTGEAGTVNDDGEILLPAGPSVAVSVVDAQKDGFLGEVLPSAQWTPPPSGMFGLMAMPNGFFIGFKDNTIFACEPYMPHAWPDAYRKTTNDRIVGGAPMGQAAVVATKRTPYLVSGSDPASLTAEEIPLDAPCINKSGIVSCGYGVMYPTYDGLALITPGAPRIITQGIMSRDHWLAFWSNTAEAVFHDGHYFAFSPTGLRKSFALKPVSDEELQFFFLEGVTARAPAINVFDDSLYLVTSSGVTMNQLTQWEGSSARRAYRWRSKIFTLPQPVSMGAAQVIASTYPVTFSLYSAPLGAGGEPATSPLTLVGTVTVEGSEPFRLWASDLSREWSFELSGTGVVQSVSVATSMEELRQS